MQTSPDLKKESNMKIKEQWQTLANEFNFKFNEGIEALFYSPHLEKIIREEIPGKISDFSEFSPSLNSPLFKGILLRISLGMMTGRYREFEFLIYRSTSTSSGLGSKSYFVNIALFFNNPYYLEMQITSAGFLSWLGKKFFPDSYIRIPNSPLDPMVAIKGKNKDQIQTMLSYNILQSQLIELFSFSKDFKITDHGIRLKHPEEILTKAYITEIMDRMISAAETFY
jgi:hypothetical protein